MFKGEGLFSKAMERVNLRSDLDFKPFVFSQSHNQVLNARSITIKMFELDLGCVSSMIPGLIQEELEHNDLFYKAVVSPSPSATILVFSFISSSTYTIVKHLLFFPLQTVDTAKP